MDEKMTNRKAKQIHEGLSQISGTLSGVKFNYAISRTTRKLDHIVKSLEDAIKPSEKFLEYENKRVALMEKFCDVDKSGNPVKELVGKHVQYSITQKLGSFQKALEKLSKEYKDAISQRETQLKDYETLLDKLTDEPVTLHMIALEEVPQDITREDFKRIEILIQEE